MIEDQEVEELSDNLTLPKVISFFNKNQNELVHFYHASDIGQVRVDTFHMFEEGELKVPYRKNENGSFMVIYTNRKIARLLIEKNFKIGSVKLRKAHQIANTLKPVNGIFIQATNCWFTIGLKELNASLG